MGVSGNSVAGKSFQIFTVSEELLAKVTEAVQAGEKEARSSGNIQSFEVFCHGFRQNISLGRVMVVPPAVCNDKQTFPTALLHGALVRIFGWGGEEIGDLIDKKIGDSEFDEYSQADFDTLKEKLFVDQKTGKEACLIVFAPNWMNSREYVCFHFTKDAEALKNNLRHQVFAAYYNPAVSSAFNALMTNVDTTKVDVTDITPKLTLPALAENPLKEYPRLDKQAGYKKATILLNRKTADEITKQTLDPQELDVFDALDTALTNSLLPDADGAQGEGGYKAPEAHPGVPREAADKTADESHADNCDCHECNAAYGEPLQRLPKGAAEKKAEIMLPKGHVKHDELNRGQAPEFQPLTGAAKKEYEKCDKCGKQAEISKELIAGQPLKKVNCKHCGNKKTKAGNKKADVNPPASHETPITNVGPGTGAAEAQKSMVPAAKESLDDAIKQNEEKATEPIGIAIDETGVPRSKAEEEKGSSKTAHIDANGMCPGCKKAGKDCACSGCTCKAASNPSNRQRNTAHPETLRVDPTRLSSAYSAAYNGGFVDKHAMPPQAVRNAMAEVGDNSKPAPHAAKDHAKQIEAGLFGDDPLNRRANEKWGGAEVKAVKRGNKEVMAEYIADVVATEIDEPSEAMSHKAKQARAKKESLLDKFRPKTAVELDIDSIWDAITEDMGPAPLVDVEADPSNPNPPNTDNRDGFELTTPENEGTGAEEGESEAKAPSTAPRKRDVQDLPEAFRSTEPEDKKEISEGEAEQQETDLENDVTKSEEHHESAWRVDAKLADFVQEVADEIEDEEELPRNRVKCDQCQMLAINGVPCHEQGCPNQGARWDSDSGNWVEQRKCFECGSTVDAEDPCCSAEEFQDREDEITNEIALPDGTDYQGDNLGPVQSLQASKKADRTILPAATTKQTPGAYGYSDISKKTMPIAQPTTKAEGAPSWVTGSEKTADTADNGYDIDSAADPSSKENGPSDTVECHQDYNTETSEGTDRPKPGQGADIKQAKGKKAERSFAFEMASVLSALEKLGFDEGEDGNLEHPTLGLFEDQSSPNGWLVGFNGKTYTDYNRLMAAIKAAGAGQSKLPKKEGDTAQNPYNWDENKPAPAEMADVDVKDTTGGDAPPPGQKSSADISGDAAEAKAETVSPDTVDKDIQQPTVSVEDAAHKNGAEKVALHFMNEYDIDEAVQMLGNDPVLGKAVRFLAAFKDQVNSHSDGWAYWRAPVAAANGLMTLIEAGMDKRRGRQSETVIDDKAIARAMGPIKAFMTRKGLAAGMEMPKLAADISGDMSEAKSEVDYNKAEVADEPAATDTVNPEHFAGSHDPGCECATCMTRYKDVNYGGGADDEDDAAEAEALRKIPYGKPSTACRHDDVPVAEGESARGEQPVSDLSGAAPEASNVPPILSSEKSAAYGDDQPEEVEFDFGAGDLADIVMTEEVDE